MNTETNEFFSCQFSVNAEGEEGKPPVGCGEDWKSAFTTPGEGILGASVLPVVLP